MTHALDALGSPVRRAILHELRAQALSVGEIAERLPISRPAVSRHLRMLEDAGLVQNDEIGTRNIYSVRLQGFATVREFIEGFWDTALHRLQALSHPAAAREK
jgi:DNA-binding transcriptional ArsR family regulator